MAKGLRLACAAALLVVSRSSSVDDAAAMNPVRKVVTMLQAMQKKVAAEGEKEKELYEKYMCYCKNSGSDLETSIAAAETKSPQVASDIEQAEAQKAQLDQDLVSHKADRDAAKGAVADATAIREKAAGEYAEKKASYGSDITSIEKAVAALNKGMGGAFLQSTAASTLKQVVQSVENLNEADRQDLMAFLQGQQGSDYAPSSGSIVGILKELQDSMAAGLAEETAAEEAASKEFDELMVAKKKEIASLTKSIEVKTVRSGETAVSIVNMKNDLSDTEAALYEDKKFLADMSKNCATKTAEWDEIQKTRAQELLALADTIKVLNDDDALDLFKKTLPSAASSFVQVKAKSASIQARALAIIHAAQRQSAPRHQQLDLIALALHGGNKGFEKVLVMIDDMVALLKKEQTDDDSKKEYCGTELDTSDDKKKALERSVSDAESAIAEAEEGIATLTSEIKALEEGIKALDKSVAEATADRKDENEAYTELMAQDSAAVELLAFAKNRLNKFYNPKLYVAPPKRDLSAEDKIVVGFGGTAAPTPAPGGIAGTGVEVLAQISLHSDDKTAPPPPPETFGAYSTKSEESTGVISMIDMLVKDLDKEMTTAQADEKNAQADYESMMGDSAEKRASDTKSLTEKNGAKADTEAALEAHKEDKASTTAELMGTLETIKALHSECDWLIQYFDVRKEARASEVESLGTAKAVLSGADFSM